MTSAVALPPLSPMASLRWSVVRSLLDELSPRAVLEVGCGQGGFGARIAARAHYVGVEPDEQSYALARSRVEPFGGIVRHGTSDIVSADEHFDLICAFEVIEHLEDDTATLSDWVGRLNPGGAMLVSVPAWPSRFGPMDTLVGHYRRYTPEQLTDSLQDAGCVDVRVVAYGWPLGYLLEAVRNRIASRRGVSDAPMAGRSAGSGRLLQPSRLVGAAVRLGAAPFAALQRLRPGTGTGLVATARRPAA